MEKDLREMFGYVLSSTCFIQNLTVVKIMRFLYARFNRWFLDHLVVHTWKKNYLDRQGLKSLRILNESDCKVMKFVSLVTCESSED